MRATAGEGGDVARNVVRNLSLIKLRQRLNAFGNGESPATRLGMNKADYWDDVQSNLRSAETQEDYNNLLSFENRDLGIRICCSSRSEGAIKVFYLSHT